MWAPFLGIVALPGRRVSGPRREEGGLGDGAGGEDGKLNILSLRSLSWYLLLSSG